MPLYLTLFPIALLAVALIFQRKRSVRWGAVVLICCFALVSFGILMTPHRLAEERLIQTMGTSGEQALPTREWSDGARAARDVIYGALPPLALAFSALAVLSLVPYRRE